MADVFSRKQRSEIMSRVKGRGNRLTELRLLDLLSEHGFVGWRRNAAVFGRPDFVFFKTRVAIFVDGCFWHGCPTHGAIPSTNVDFWTAKLDRNKRRDRLVVRELKKRGWIPVRIWQHELRRPELVLRRLDRVLERSPRRSATKR
ncbi:DNA mismatch endonuclease Vsr [Bradyrhizobium sp. KBS0727]|uniref:DNA mismatch endonuclease Vsr n=1 Tax=unclassified Bradyrhizobium TaxID=2631580 RepID=UPI00110DC5C4|nr:MULTISPECIES: DNA mismatch endonuclease Vsr [unclassified Bradyrhizobium]QDW40476.1 DNA mismatch endonuclease Vsr [Bradyrhizobium sp. KBS0725]QDW47080.1 DNA mismatch endonuclease Vsr [Bradyrhizobium sp. KBS0727]